MKLAYGQGRERSLKRKRDREQTEFIKLIRHHMIDRDIDNAGELYELISDKGMEGRQTSRTTIYNYFSGDNLPQPWFFVALLKAFEEMGAPLSHDEIGDLMWAYFRSYSSTRYKER
jgi:hypothetical protein